VLVRLGLTTAMWTAAVSAWTDALLEESEVDGKALAGVYGTTFVKTRARLRLETPEIASLGPLVVEEPAAPEAAAPAAPGIELAPPPPPRAHETVAEPPPFAFASGDVSPWARPVLQPFTPGEGSFAAPPSFVPAPVSEPEISWMPAAMRCFTSVDATQTGGDAPTAPVLPFASDAGARAGALENALGEAARTQGPPSERAVGEEVGSTMALTGLRARVQAAALPFPSASAPSGMERQGPHPGPVTGQGPEVTMALPGLRSLAQGTALPVFFASAPAPVDTLALPLERYASLCVELGLAPERRAETLRRYQLTELQWSLVEREWQVRFTRDPPARTAWEHACRAYRAWLMTSQK
jgi:hypothetical protein